MSPIQSSVSPILQLFKHKYPKVIMAQEASRIQHTMFVINDCSRMMCLLYIDRLTVFSRFLLCSGVSFMTLALGKLRPPAKLMQTILIQPVSSKSRRDCWAFYSL